MVEITAVSFFFFFGGGGRGQEGAVVVVFFLEIKASICCLSFFSLKEVLLDTLLSSLHRLALRFGLHASVFALSCHFKV